MVSKWRLSLESLFLFYWKTELTTLYSDVVSQSLHTHAAKSMTSNVPDSSQSHKKTSFKMPEHGLQEGHWEQNDFVSNG